MTGEHGQLLTDPVGVAVAVITRMDADLDPEVVGEVVATVAAGRAKRRRLAQALADDPSVLVDGRSPAPRVVGELLIALHTTGARRLSLPVCAGCGKQLRSFQRRGDDWFCGGCGPEPEPCAACGATRPVSTRDRNGRPRCVGCPPHDDGHDPIETVVGIVATIDPDLSATRVAAAVGAVTSHAGQRRRLAWTLEDRPELLTGAGAEAPTPAVLRLIDELAEAGAQGIIRPPCPGCGRVIALVKPRHGVRLCRSCVARSRAEPCSRCGAVREPATRDGHGAPLCPDCLVAAPVNQEVCAGCRRRRPVAVRVPHGPLCATCRPVKTATCSICGREAPCEVSQMTGRPRCHACQKRWMGCSSCGQVRPVGGGSLQAPLCAACLAGDTPWPPCAGCGRIERVHPGLCTRCTLDRRVRQLLDDGTGHVRAELRVLHRTLVEAERPATVTSWLAKNSAAAVLAALARGDEPLTHQALDELLPSKPVEHLRSMLVATGALPARDEQLARIERWITTVIDERANPPDTELLNRYAVWHLLRRLRQRNRGADTTHSQAVGVQRHVRAALGLLDWFAAHDLTLTTARQGDLEGWLSSGEATGRREVGHFVRWANSHKLTSLELPAVRWDGPSGVIDTEARWEQARWLLHDDTIDPDDRLAGLLVLLYAQQPATISRLSLAHVDIRHDQPRLRLGDEPVVLPEPLAALIREQVACRKGHAVLGDQGSSPWLFPGGQPGRPISAYQLGQRLRLLGLRPAQARSTALFQLATELPAALLARMLGIHIAVAVAWQHASAGDWTGYAAEVARRTEAKAP